MVLFGLFCSGSEGALTFLTVHQSAPEVYRPPSSPWWPDPGQACKIWSVLVWFEFIGCVWFYWFGLVWFWLSQSTDLVRQFINRPLTCVRFSLPWSGLVWFFGLGRLYYRSRQFINWPLRLVTHTTGPIKAPWHASCIREEWSKVQF